MKKVLSTAVLSLAVCTLAVPSVRSQTGNVRVGPLADERAAGAATTSNAKSEDKKSQPKTAARDERQSKPAEATGNNGSGKEGAKKADAKDVQTPAAISSAATVTPSGAVTSSASDAPLKTGDKPLLPPPTLPSKSTSQELGGDTEGAKIAPPPVSTANTGANANVAAVVTSPALTPAPPPTSLYRIGTGDVLDIRLLNLADPRQSTLYTVMAGGVLEYPLVADPVTAAGMTTEELAAQLIAELRHRGVYNKPQVRISVRDYASHTVLVSGLVSDPGPKTLQREAVPLYVVVAWAQPKAEAGRAVVVSHASGRSTTVDLNDAAAMNILVQQSDVVTLVARPPEFFYTGGEINSPGQKDFHPGMTLTQAVLASGGAARPDSMRVKVSRQGADGRLISTEYNLREIEEGKIPDPALQPGDRVEVGRYTRK